MDDIGNRLRRPGGTPGGLGEFVVGFLLACAGGYLLLTRTRVSSGLWSFFGLGDASIGYALIPLCAGIAFLFFDARSIVGWLLTGGSAVALLAGILTSLHLYFEPTSLFGLVVMLVLLFGGLGLIARALRTHGSG